MRSNTLAALLLLALAAPTVAHAQGNPEAGKRLVYTCAGCHGITGYTNAYPNYHVPRISGQNQQYLVNVLKEYQSGARKHPTMMAQAQSLSEQDILDITSYLANPPAP